ncbi:hypothetical protein D3Z50_16720 [Clostridiaceae bacterium]|nr:hypothetical protein [Clostridiaceae bacterium]
MFRLREMRSMLAMLSASVGTVFFLLLAAQLLPTKAIYEHVEGSMPPFVSEGDYFKTAACKTREFKWPE